ncbi:MAG: 50S ribosomal protein L25 [Candidatus Paceibacteria bacterium]
MSYSIAASIREEDPDQLRDQDRIPAVVYGPDIDSTSISVDNLEFRKLIKEAGISNLVDLNIEDEDESLKVLVQDLQYDPVKNNVIHADFKQIPMDKELTTEIPVEFTGTAPAVKAHGGVFLSEMEELKVTCLPENLVDHIEVDISQLEEIDDSIFVRDIEAPEGVTLEDDKDQLVAKVAEVTVEEFDEEEEDEMSIEDVEVEGEKEEELEEETEEDETEEDETEEEEPQAE